MDGVTTNDSRYFATALKMDRAFMELLETTPYPLITVKDLCRQAKVNRSTFYLHYESMADLAAESIGVLNAQFFGSIEQDAGAFKSRIAGAPLNELYLVTPRYLEPYLGFIKKHQRVFRTAVDNPDVLMLDKHYSTLFSTVFDPILERFGVPEDDRQYMVTFYIHGLMAIIVRWMKSGCAESVAHIMALIQQCVVPLPQPPANQPPADGED